MNREQSITAEKVNNLIDVLVTVLNSDIENSGGRGIDPNDHLTALSFVLCNAALELHLTRNEFMLAVMNTFDECRSLRQEVIGEGERHATND